MLQAEYRHDIQKNYLVIQKRGEENYMLHMLAGKHVQGFLSLEIREINNEKEYYYDITGRENLLQKSNREKWKDFQVRNCISQVLTEIGKCREYLLNPDNLVLDPAYIYIDTQNKEVALCYVHDYQREINGQLAGLFSYFMNVIDYQDKKAVEIVYQLYEKSKEPHCTLNDLQKIVAWVTKTPVIKKLNTETIEKENNLQLLKNKKSLISGSNRKMDGDMEGKLERKNTRKNKSIPEKKRSDGENKEEKKKRNIRENIILTAILQVALLFLLAVAAKSGVFSDERGISITKAVIGLLVLGALDMFILGRVFAAGEEDIKIRENIKMKEEKNIKEETNFKEDAKMKEKNEEILKVIRKIQYEKEIKQEDSPISFVRNQEEIKLPLDNCNMGDGTVKVDYDKTVMQINNNICEKKQCYLVPEEQGQEIIPLGEFPFFIGRFQKDTYSLNNKKNISRMHSKIDHTGEQFFITDLNSTNGTFVNEKRIEGNQPIVLTEGDKISFADIPYYFTKEWKAS